jgi:hypothetical protein
MPKFETYDPATALTGTELFLVLQSSETRKATSDQIQTFAEGAQGVRSSRIRGSG